MVGRDCYFWGGWDFPMRAKYRDPTAVACVGGWVCLWVGACMLQVQMSICAYFQQSQYRLTAQVFLGCRAAEQESSSGERQGGRGKEWGRGCGPGGWMGTRSGMLPAWTGNSRNPILEKVVRYSTVVSRQTCALPLCRIRACVRACVCCGQTAEWLWARQPVHWRSHPVRAYGAPKSGSAGVAGAKQTLG